LVRRFGKGRGLQPIHTWLLAGILFGLGSTMPHLLGLALEDRYSRYHRYSDFQSIYVPSPVDAIEDVLDSSSSHLGLIFVFLVMWGVLTTVLNIYWFAAQISAFKPAEKPIEKIVPIQVEVEAEPA
jgi:hypothetical protein